MSAALGGRAGQILWKWLPRAPGIDFWFWGLFTLNVRPPNGHWPGFQPVLIKGSFCVTFHRLSCSVSLPVPLGSNLSLLKVLARSVPQIYRWDKVISSWSWNTSVKWNIQPHQAILDESVGLASNSRPQQETDEETLPCPAATCLRRQGSPKAFSVAPKGWFKGIRRSGS